MRRLWRREIGMSHASLRFTGDKQDPLENSIDRAWALFRMRLRAKGTVKDFRWFLRGRTLMTNCGNGRNTLRSCRSRAWGNVWNRAAFLMDHNRVPYHGYYVHSCALRKGGTAFHLTPPQPPFYLIDFYSLPFPRGNEMSPPASRLIGLRITLYVVITGNMRRWY